MEIQAHVFWTKFLYLKMFVANSYCVLLSPYVCEQCSLIFWDSSFILNSARLEENSKNTESDAQKYLQSGKILLVAPCILTSRRPQ